MEKADWLVYFFVGPLLVIIVLVVRLFPPKNINDFYGYRTKRAKKNQKAWDTAQRYSERLSLLLFTCLSILELPLFIFLERPKSALLSTGLMVVTCIVLFVATENHLKKMFPDN